jgi:hypothetical protein
VSYEIEQRYELAALLCEGLRVLDLGQASEETRRPLADAAGSLSAGEDGGARFDAVVCLVGDPPPAERLTRLARGGARVLAAFERGREGARSPRAESPAADRAQELAEQLGDAVVLPQFLAEGSLIGLPNGSEAALALHDGGAGPDDAAALIVASGFAPEALSSARASLRVSAEPVLSSYVRRLELAHAELLRANRRLMAERVGREGSAAASLLDAQRQLEEMKEIARRHEEQAHRMEAWYDAPRYHLVDRVRGVLTRIPGFTGFVRFLWSLVSTRAETPKLDAAANPEPDEAENAELAEVTRDREGREQDDEESEPTEVISRLEQ